MNGPFKESIIILGQQYDSPMKSLRYPIIELPQMAILLQTSPNTTSQINIIRNTTVFIQ